MPTRDVVAFCTVLVRAFFGDNAALVASTLLTYGRSDCTDLTRRCKMQPKLVKRCLAALMQHGLCQYGKFPPSHEDDRERILYECNHVQIAALSQVGKAILHTSRTLSVYSAAMAKHVLTQGRVRVRDLLQQFVAHGESDNYDASPAALEHRIIHLLYERFFVFAKPTDAIIPAEHHRELRATIKAEAKKSLSEAKLKLHIEERVAAEVGKQQRAEDEKLHALHRAVADLTSLGGGADGPPRKKVKTESGALATTLLDGDAFVRFNYSKLGVISRTNDLVKLCTVCYGEEVGQVYGKMLATLQLTTSSCTQNTKRCRVITEKDVARAVPADLFLDDAWCSPPPSTRKVRKQRTQAPVIHNGDNSDEIMSDEERSEDSEVGQDTRGPSIHSKRILALLANSHIPFVSKTGPEAYVLDFDILGQVLRERQIEALVMQQLGPTALRLLRIVKEKRKIDEKQLYAMALLQHKDIRQALTNLHQLGVLELQEVPKRLDRQPSLTLYFWFHKQDKAAMTLASQMCQAMARIHQRLEAMLKEKSRLLAKSKRTDVRNREAELMSPAELRDLRGVYAMQDRLLCQCARAYHAYRSLIQY